MKEIFAKLYAKLFKINDTPQRISLGLGIGVFAGIMPGTGPLAALFLALALRVNRASALLASLLTNTWLSLVTFLLAVKTGSWAMGLSWKETYAHWVAFLKDFHWVNLLKISLLKIILPVIVGYLIIGFLLGFLAYLASLVIILHQRKGPVK